MTNPAQPAGKNGLIAAIVWAFGVVATHVLIVKTLDTDARVYPIALIALNLVLLVALGIWLPGRVSPSWHPAKVILLWAGVAALWLIGDTMGLGGGTLVLVAPSALATALITWFWLSAREGSGSSTVERARLTAGTGDVIATGTPNAIKDIRVRRGQAVAKIFGSRARDDAGASR